MIICSISMKRSLPLKHFIDGHHTQQLITSTISVIDEGLDGV